MRASFVRRVFVALACLCTVACMPAQGSAWQLFTLSPLPRAEESPARDSLSSARPAIGVGPIHLPRYLDQDQIVHRISENHFTLSESDRWAEPLAHNVAGVVAENLSNLLQADRVTAGAWPGSQRPLQQLEIDVLRFETDTMGTAHLAARYLLRDVASGQTLVSREARLTATATNRSTEQSVAAMSKALAELSVGIAAVIRECRPTPSRMR